MKKGVKPPASPFVSRPVEVDGVRYPCKLFVPGEWAGAAPPVILFLHGAGERGRDGVAQTTVGLGPAVARRAEDFPAIVVMPQAPATGAWTGAAARAAVVALDDAMEEFGGDPARVYLTGVSMGGYGACEIALADPEGFAALVPVCGGLRPHVAFPGSTDRAASGSATSLVDRAAARLARIPIRVFHGSADRIVPVGESRVMVDALRRAGADVLYTEYPGVGHNAWDPAYAEPELWSWMFGQRRRG